MTFCLAPLPCLSTWVEHVSNLARALMFYAKLKLPTVSDAEKIKRVEDLIVELGLTKVRDSIIGWVGNDAGNSGLTRGLSGGERKRLSIGQQLITDPPLLFLVLVLPPIVLAYFF